jgi:hypothetical protein
MESLLTCSTQEEYFYLIELLDGKDLTQLVGN